MNRVQNTYPGQVLTESHQFTLASGTVTLTTGLRRWRPVAVVQYAASSSTNETFSVIGTPDDAGYFSGDIVIKSNNGSSALKGFVKVEGF